MPDDATRSHTAKYDCAADEEWAACIWPDCCAGDGKCPAAPSAPPPPDPDAA